MKWHGGGTRVTNARASYVHNGVISNAPFQKGRLTIDYLNNHVGYSETKAMKRRKIRSFVNDNSSFLC
ncbi:hypothetical protein [Spirosoma linguale]|uniref:Uncharacterized protein n=1 Tax=Spirosoma linguale (strain ATCC 33905 / DSM 74 / LMG 10896 / Claus 1) TaxID=504472 RepID=D2QMS8_SPILD|nr:hypothetical protein Slin_4511 [Spirosoma linguale DSM 74]